MKENIISVSLHLFLNHGFKSVTMDDIANEMGISKKTLYEHFENKTKLVEEVTFQRFERTRLEMEIISQDALNPIQELYALKIYVLQQLKDETTSTNYQLKKYYSNVHETLKQMLCEKIHLSIMASLENGKASGVFKKTIDTEFISRMYYSSMTGIKDNMSFPKGKHESDYLIENYLHYHLTAIVTKKGKKLLKNLMNSNI